MKTISPAIMEIISECNAAIIPDIYDRPDMVTILLDGQFLCSCLPSRVHEWVSGFYTPSNHPMANASAFFAVNPSFTLD